jgi:hypothetical protein
VRLDVQNVFGDQCAAFDASGLIRPDKANWRWRRRHGGVPFLVAQKRKTPTSFVFSRSRRKPRSRISARTLSETTARFSAASPARSAGRKGIKRRIHSGAAHWKRLIRLRAGCTPRYGLPVPTA